MAEGFARAYGSDVLEAHSAGLAPALALAPLTHAVMLEKNIDLGDFFPKEMDRTMDPVQRDADLVVNMSGYDLQVKNGVPVEVWDVPDPIGESEEVFRQVRDDIERRVQALIERLRAAQAVAPDAGANGAPTNGTPVDTQRRPTRQ